MTQRGRAERKTKHAPAAWKRNHPVKYVRKNVKRAKTRVVRARRRLDKQIVQDET
jgi:hypothetical protein